MAGFNSPSTGRDQPGSASSSPYSNRITHLFPQLKASPQTPPASPVLSEPAIKDTASPTDTNNTRAEGTTPSETQPEAPRRASPSSKPLNSPQPAIEATALKLAQIAAEPGEFWLVERDGWDPWPAVICDERIVSRFFKHRWQHRVSSRRSNGTWSKKFTEHGELVGKRTFPALLLALNKCVWVPCHRLLPLDLQMAARKQDIRGKKQLSLAYKLAAEQKPLRIWEDILIVHRRRTGKGGAASRSAEDGTRERLPSPGIGGGSGRESESEVAFRFPPGFVDGEEVEGSGALFLRTPSPSVGKTAKWGFEDGMRQGSGSEATFTFLPGLAEGEQTANSESLPLATPPASMRKIGKRGFDDGMGLEDVEALHEDSDTDEVRARRSRRAKRIRQESMSTQELLPSKGSNASTEVEVVEISD